MQPRSERAIRFVAALAISSLIVGFVLFSFPAQKSNDARDFSEFYAAAQMVRQGLGRDLYDLRTQAEFQSRVAPVQVFYNHPPFETLIFLPLTYFDYRAAYMLWTLISVGMLAGAARLIESHTHVSATIFRYTRIPVDFGLAFLVFLTFAPVTTSLLLGQDSMLMLLIYTLVFVLLQSGAEFRAGCVLACGLFKFQLIVPFVLILLLRRRGAAARGFGVAGSLLILASIGVSGIRSGRSAGWRSRSTASIRWRCRWSATSGRGCSATTTRRSSCSTARWRPTPARPSPGCAAAPPSATSARRARRGGGSISGCGCRLTTRMCSSATGCGAGGYAAGDWDDAAQWGRRSMAANPRFVGNLRFLAASLAANGQREEARAVGRALLQLNPSFRVAPSPRAMPSRIPSQRRLFGDHLVMAGLPE